MIEAGDKPAFAHAQHLGGMQADHGGQGNLAHRIEGGGGVDDHRQAARAAELGPGLHVQRMAKRRHDNGRHHRTGRALQSLGQYFGRQAPAVDIHVEEPGLEPGLNGRVGGGDKGPGGHGHQAAGRQLQSLQGQGQALGAVCHGGQGGARFEPRRKPRLELHQQGAIVGIPAALVDGFQIGQHHLGWRKIGPGHRNMGRGGGRLFDRPQGSLDRHGCGKVRLIRAPNRP